MECFVRGSPSYDDLSTVQKKMLISPLCMAIKEFYKNENNKKAFEEWQKRKTPTIALAKQNSECVPISTNIIAKETQTLQEK